MWPGIHSRYATTPHHQRRTSVISQAGVLPGAAPTSPFQPKPPDLTCQHHHHHQHHTHNHRHHQLMYKEKQKIHRGELLMQAQDVSLRRCFAAPCMKSAGSAWKSGADGPSVGRGGSIVGGGRTISPIVGMSLTFKLSFQSWYPSFYSFCIFTFLPRFLLSI